MLIFAIDSEVLFQSLVCLFSLSITLGMISRSEVKLHFECSSEGPEEVGYEFRATIGSDLAWNTMLRENMENEWLRELLRRNGVMSRNEE